MDFVASEEAQHLQPSSHPVSNPPFAFLQLPREVRDSIYYYAILRTNAGPVVPPPLMRHIQSLQQSATASTFHWETENSTHLFCVSRQISFEARHLCYSSFPFHFPLWIDVGFVNTTIRDTLSPWARGLITKIGFTFSLWCRAAAYSASDERVQRSVAEAVLGLLPNVRSVRVVIWFVDLDVPNYEVEDAVAHALEMVIPLRKAPRLVVVGAGDQNAKQMRLLEGIRDGLRRA